MQQNYKCPFNYIGSKSKLLDQILPIINTYEAEIMVDLFAGGFSVGVNANSDTIVYNDVNEHMAKLIRFIYETDYTELLTMIYKKIDEYQLSDLNKDAYYQLKSDFNQTKNTLLFLLLIYYSFNHQIRFNQKGEFNTPFGQKRSKFSKTSEIKLEVFAKKLKEKNIVVMSTDFNNVDIKDMKTHNTLFFCDPPYLITSGSYNDGHRGVSFWNESKERELLAYLDFLHDNNIKFVLTNIIVSGEIKNDILIEWMQKYNVVDIDSNYSNSNYQKRDLTQQEVVVTNLPIGQ